MYASRYNYAKICALTVAFTVVITSLSVMFGWVFELDSLTQIQDNFAPMQFNTALLFLISSVTIILLIIKKDKLALILSSLLFLFSLLIFSQYIFEINIGIDTLFVTPFTSVKTTHIGRPSPSTLICFSLLGLSISSFLWSTKRAAIIPSLILSTMVIAVSLLSVISYLDERFTFEWYDLSRMALHTSLSMLGLAIVSSFTMLEQTPVKRFQKTIYSIPLFCLMGTIAVMMWVSFSVQEKNRVVENQNIQNIRIIDAIEHTIFTNYYTLVRFGTRAQKLSRLDNAYFKKDLINYLRTIDALDFVGVSGSDGSWVYSEGEGKSFTNLDFKTLLTKENLEDISMQISFINDLSYLLLAYPIEHGSEHRGFIVGAYRFKTIIKESVPELLNGDQEISIYFDDTLVFGNPIPQSSAIKATNEILGHRISAQCEKDEVLNSSEGILPEIAGIGGLLLALAAAAALYQYQQAKERSDENDRNLILTQAILNSMDNGVVTIAKFNEVRLVNPRALALLETTKEEFLSWFSVRKLSGNDMNRNKHPIELSLENDLKITNAVDTFHRPNKTSFTAEYTTRNIGSKRKSITVLVFKDITARLSTERQLNDSLIDLKEQNLQLEMEKERAETANRAKSQFLANMSHELRTPLNGIIGIGELFKKTNLNDRQSNYVQLLCQSSESLYQLINDTLDINKIESGYIQVKSEKFSLPNLIGQLSKVHSIQCERKDLKYNYIIDDEIPQTLYGDPNRIKQVLGNIMTNALKFTHKGSIDLSVTHIGIEETKYLVKFEVSDTGIGVTKEAIPKLFNTFSQADYSHSRKYGGSGLGLAIVKKLVLLMGGDIGVRSEVDKGSTFWFTVPLDMYKPEDTGE